MIEIIIVNGTSELMPKFHYFLAHNGLSVHRSNVIPDVTIAEGEVKTEVSLKKSEIREMIREIRSVLNRYRNAQMDSKYGKQTTNEIPKELSD